MNKVIETQNLTRIFKVHEKEEGIKGSVKALFKRKHKIIKAVDGISFNVKRGELIGFIGLNGAGKTTTLKMLSGLLHPTKGSATVLGFTPFERKPEYLKQISLVMGQKNQLWWDLPAIETFNLNREIYEVPLAKYKKVLEELIEILELKDIIHQQVRRLSLGQRMKCELVAALIHTPKILFLDEPTIGLDVIMQKRMREFIKEYNSRYEATIILTSHNMDDVREICERIVMIHKGKLIFDGKIGGLIKQYADYKLLIPIFNQRVNQQKLGEIGRVQEYDFPKAVINVPRKKTAEKAAELLKKFDIDDLNINEPRLEDVIRSIFGEGK